MGPKTLKKTTADLLIYLCKNINMRKYCKRELIDLDKKITSIIGGRIPGTGSQILVLDNQIEILRKHLHKTAEKILRNNSLTAKDINVEDFELGSKDLTDGYTELQSSDDKQVYFYHIAYGELALYTTVKDQYLPATVALVKARHSLDDMRDYVQFMKLPPF
jgi:hypothetical protein